MPKVIWIHNFVMKKSATLVATGRHQIATSGKKHVFCDKKKTRGL